MSYYDEEFRLWEIIDGKCVVADEAEWANVKKFHRDSRKCKCCRTGCDGGDPKDCELYGLPRPIVKVTTDIFENVEGPVVNRSGFKLLEWDWDQVDGDGLVSKDYPLTRFFQTVDSTPRVDYLIPTQHPELVRGKWIGCKRDYNKDGDCDRHKNGCPKSNVILATYVETQADIERLIPELLKCHGLCKGLAVICNPKEGLNFNVVLQGRGENEYGITYHNLYRPLQGVVQEVDSDIQRPTGRINLIIAEGNEHPDHVQSLRNQASEANVEFKEKLNE